MRDNAGAGCLGKHGAILHNTTGRLEKLEPQEAITDIVANAVNFIRY